MARAVEVDEVELMKLRQLGGVINTIMQHPDAKLLAEKAAKMAIPTAVTPNLDRAIAMEEPINALRKELADERAERLAERAEREKNEKLGAIRRTQDDGFTKLRRNKWTDDGIKAVEKIMEEKGILDPMDAAAIYEKHNPPQVAAPSSAGVGRWNFAEQVTDEDGDLKKLLADKNAPHNDVLADKMAREALAEFRNAQQRAA